MKPFSIIVSADSIRAERGGMITGLLHVSTCSYAFPDPEWNDFVAIVLGWWCTALAGLVAGNTTVARLRFMDGPFEIEASTASDGGLMIRLLERGREAHLVGPGAIEEIGTQVLSAAREVIQFCEKASIAGTDVAELRGGIAALRAALRLARQGGGAV